jgi:hypothetical protein
MRERGIGRRRFMAGAAVLIALSVAAPELASPASAATARASTRTEMQQSRPAARHELLAKRRKKRSKAALAKRRRARLIRYLRQHPALVAQHLRATGTKIRTAALRKKPRLVRAYLKTHPNLRKGSPAKVTPRKTVRKPIKAPRRAPTKKKKKKKVTAAALAAAKRKKNASKSHPLGLTGWGEILLLAMLPLLAVGLLLFITDRLRQPPAPPTPKRRRRTLVITPLHRNR